MAVLFTINGQHYDVSPDDVPVDTSLNTFIRNYAHLTGTKFMCLEGGCGVCIVNIKGVHPVTKEPTSHAVNSCLFSVFSCHGMDILTVEGIGSKADGYHSVQQRLAFFNGSQCGFCSPGMVMSMYSLLDSRKGDLTMAEVENSLDGNICRCTGYRPILDTFKSFATDATDKLVNMCRDIEDLEKACNKGNAVYCQTKCSSNNVCKSDMPLHLCFKDGSEWHKVYSVDKILEVLENAGSKPYIIVAGNTGHGVYRRSADLKVFIDVNSVEELHSFWIGSELIVGANVSLGNFIDILREAALKHQKYKYCIEIANHVSMIAHVAVRNVGTLAGNLTLKRLHHEFPSDLYILLEAVGAHITITNLNKSIERVTPQQFIKMDMHKKLMTSIVLPVLDPAYYLFRSYKVQPRAQNSKAYVNAAFMVKLCARQTNLAHSAVCFGGIHPSFTHAIETEKLLLGKYLFRNDIVQAALNTLDMELHPEWILPDPNPTFRKQAALGLFYRFVLSIAPKNKKLVGVRFASGAAVLERPLSSGSQSFDTYPKNWPLTKNVPKIEALAQTSGEAKYINDIPCISNALYAAFVLATQPKRRILQINTLKAMELKGVVAFYSAKDIPGINDFMPLQFGINHFFQIGYEPEEVFCSGKVLYHGQPVGLIVAESFDIANCAACLVEVTYSDQPEEMIYTTVEDVMLAKATNRIFDQSNGKTGSAYATAASGDMVIHGNVYLATQYHYTLEAQTCVCVPKEDGMDVYSSTQWLHLVQAAISRVLNIPQNKVNYYCRRVGGAYGSKITRSSQIASACAIAAHLTQRPVRLVMTIESNMSSIGKRQGCWSDYVVEVNNNGQILKLTNTYTHDFGCSINEPLSLLFRNSFKNCYDDSAWRTIPKGAITDIASNTWLRAPGTAEAIATIETIIEHIANQTSIDPLDVRIANIPLDSDMRELLPQFRLDVDFDKRRQEIDAFNNANRWRKRGISIVPLAHPIIYAGTVDAFVSIHHLDGTVSITHSGVDMGQGINTKAAQVAAHILGIHLDKVAIKTINSMSSPNAFVAGGSITSTSVAYAVKSACEILLERMRPVRETNPNISWEVLVNTCFASNISLSARYFAKATEHNPYTVWVLCCTELELDVLTGAVRLPRVDILEDTGESMSPGIDIGQIEGAFIMGVGYFLTESLVYRKTDGALMNNRTWNYKPPGAKDIPTDFRIRFLQKASNPIGILRSKSTGEPAYNVAVSSVFALRYALVAARKDAGLNNDWLQLGSSLTIDNILLLTGNKTSQFLINDY